MSRDQLVRAVIADPDASAAREAFAVWGEAHGDLQGRLARIQLAEAHERRVGTTEAVQQHHAEARMLIEQHGASWSSAVLPIASQPLFFRGFVESVTIDVPTFLARAAELYAVAPIRSITFVDTGSDIAALAASPELARLVAIGFYNRSGAAALGDDGVRALAASPYVDKLAILRLSFNEVGRDGVEALAASRRLGRLQYAVLGNNPIDDVAEDYAIDGMTGEINRNSIALPPLGRELEARYGELRWLHAPSLCRMFPPDEHDV